MTEKADCSFGQCKICGELTALKNNVCHRQKCIITEQGNKFAKFFENNLMSKDCT